MNYLASITDFFKSPKWMMNLLLGSLCCMIPIVGSMVYFGHLITSFWCRQDTSFVTFPDFDFSKFGKNLERGVWPALVGFALALVVLPIVFVVVFSIIFATGGLAGRHGDGMSILAMLGMLLIMGLVLVAWAAGSILFPPIFLRAARLQDFAPAFNINYIKRFASTMWKECLIIFAFWLGVSVALMIPAMIPCIGSLLIWSCTSVLLFAHFHLMNQLYNLYVSRGGAAIPLSPKFTEEPPAAPLPPAPLPPATPPPPTTPLPPAPPPGGPPIG
jgi:hypothetical protein